MKRLIEKIDFSRCAYSEHETEELKRTVDSMGMRMLRCCHLPEAYFQELETYLCNVVYRILLLEKKPLNLEAYCYVAIRNSIYEMLKLKKDWNKKNVPIEEIQEA